MMFLRKLRTLEMRLPQPDGTVRTRCVWTYGTSACSALALDVAWLYARAAVGRPPAFPRAVVLPSRSRLRSCAGAAGAPPP